MDPYFISDLIPGDVYESATGSLYTVVGPGEADSDGDLRYPCVNAEGGPVGDLYVSRDDKIHRMRDRQVSHTYVNDLAPGDSFDWLGTTYVVHSVREIDLVARRVTYNVTRAATDVRDMLYCSTEYALTRKSSAPTVEPTERTFTLTEFAEITRAAAEKMGWCADGVAEFLAERGITLPAKRRTLTVVVDDSTLSAAHARRALQVHGFQNVEVTEA